MQGNFVAIAGNVTRAPELRFTSSGQATATFGVAVNKKWKDNNDEWQERVSFFNVVCWRELAENCAASLEKGARVVVTGTFEQRSWEKDGVTKTVFEVTAEEVGASLKWAEAAISKNVRSDQTESGQRNQGRTTTPAPEPGYEPWPEDDVTGRPF